MNWTLIITAIVCLYIGSNIPKAIEQWKASVIYLNKRQQVAKQ